MQPELQRVEVEPIAQGDDELAVDDTLLRQVRAYGVNDLGYAVTNVISVIVVANCFGRGVEMVGLAGSLGDAIAGVPGLLFPLAVALPLGFAWLSGSGMAGTSFANIGATGGITGSCIPASFQEAPKAAKPSCDTLSGQIRIRRGE